MKVAIYARVSTEHQQEQKTIESQVDELRRICNKQGVYIVREYVDNGWSGETLDRPELDRLRTEASQGIFERVYFYCNDRLSRNLSNQGIIVQELERKGIEVYFYDKPIADTPEGRFLFQILGAASEFEKAKILERTRRGKLYKARRGVVVGSLSPLGFEYIKKTKEKDGYYIINKSEAEIINLVFDLYLQFGSVREVAKALTNRNVKPKKGRHWRTSTLHRILRNETYIGTTYFNKSYAIETSTVKQKYRKIVKTGRKMRDKKDWIPIAVSPIIEKSKFNAVQVLLAKNHRAFVSGGNHYLLGGLLKCAICDSPVGGELSHGHRFYRCNNRHRTFPLPKKCNAKMIGVDKLDPAVWESVTRAIMDPRILVKYILDKTEKIKKNAGSLNTEIESLRQEKN
ncbi:MAG: recombinase family protein, partial [Patescibacteria group bacterium]|nr:recombinase family protein [Patescibacteria group bacterium]